MSAPGGRSVRPWARRRAAPAAWPSSRVQRGLARPARHRCRQVLPAPRRELRQCRRPARRSCDAHTPVTNACGYGKMASPHAALVQPVTSCRIVLAYASSGLHNTPCMHAQAMLQSDVGRHCRERVRQRRSQASLLLQAHASPTRASPMLQGTCDACINRSRAQHGGGPVPLQLLGKGAPRQRAAPGGLDALRSGAAARQGQACARAAPGGLQRRGGRAAARQSQARARAAPGRLVAAASWRCARPSASARHRPVTRPVATSAAQRAAASPSVLAPYLRASMYAAAAASATGRRRPHTRE
jgi:hypothetical protein